MHEAARHKVGMLSYSPRQIVHGLWRALADAAGLLRTGAGLSAGQGLRSRRSASPRPTGSFCSSSARPTGGSAATPAVADKVLEDVELAFLAKRRKVGLRFRYAEDAVSTRMYRTTAAMIEGWTKNLALLFDNAWRWPSGGLWIFFLLFGCRCWRSSCGMRASVAHSLQWLGAGWVLALLWVRNLFRFYGRVAKSNFPFLDCAISPLGLPLFVVLLYRSWFQHRILKRVSWKGRELQSVRDLACSYD